MMGVGTKIERHSSSDQSLSQEVGNFGWKLQVAIEEHQAGELGVHQLHYLYRLLKATSAYDTGNLPLA